LVLGSLLAVDQHLRHVERHTPLIEQIRRRNSNNTDWLFRIIRSASRFPSARPLATNLSIARRLSSPNVFCVGRKWERFLFTLSQRRTPRTGWISAVLRVWSASSSGIPTRTC
jgi:hypothetical protein